MRSVLVMHRPHDGCWVVGQKLSPTEYASATAPHTVTSVDSVHPSLMIRGKVSGDQQALVTVDIMDGEGLLQPVEVVLDTGFTGYLTLPSDSIQELGLPSVGRRTFELANGELYEFDAYLAAVSWHGRLSDALVLKSDSA